MNYDPNDYQGRGKPPDDTDWLTPALFIIVLVSATFILDMIWSH